MSITRLYRADDWWTGKASLLIGLVYLFSIYFAIPFNSFWKWGALSLITIIGFASLGYWVNDYFDQAKDALAGKKNFLLGKTKSLQITLCFIALLLLILPWIVLPHNSTILILSFAQIGCYFLYAIPAIRLKEKGLWGIVTDALYAHVLPTVIAVHTYALIAKEPIPALFLLPLVCWQLFLGIRNVIQHQLNDLESDKKSGTITFIQTLSHSPKTILPYLKSIELIFLFLLLTSLCVMNQLFVIALITSLLGAFIMLTMQHNNGYRIYFPNILYEQFIPYAFIVILAFSDSRFLILVPLHAVLFSKSIVLFFYKNVRFKFYAGRIYYNIGYGVQSLFNQFRILGNWFIYICFRIVGVDLVKEKTDAKSYIVKQLNRRK